MLQASLFAPPSPAVAATAPVLALRPYQHEALAAIRAGYAAGVRRPLVVLPTGAGKTVVFAHLIRDLPGRALVLAHRDELIGQAADKLGQVDPSAIVGRVQAEWDEWRAPVVVASVQSLAQPGRLARYRPGHFDTIIVDEAHHATAKTYRTILGHLGALDAGTGVLTVGVTATPDRGDGVGLGHVFERIVYERGLPEMIAEGYLVPLRGIRVAIDADFGTLRVRAGEVSESDAARLLLAADAPGLVAAAYRRHAAGQRAIVFTPTVQVAEACAAALVAAGVRAESLDGTTPAEERRGILARLRSGATSVVCNCGVLTEGFDEPRVSCVIVARPTRSRGLYCLDADTEVLTDRGWFGIDDPIPAGTQAAGFDQATSEIRWTPILGEVRRFMRPEEHMYSCVGPAVDIRVTDQHQMLYRRRREDRKEDSWQRTTAAEVASFRTLFELPAAGIQAASGVPLSDDELRFVGWVLSDGSMNPINGQITITQGEHQPWLAELERCLEACGFKYGRRVTARRGAYDASSDAVVFTISRGEPRGRDNHLRGWGDLAGYLDKDFSPALEGMDRRQFGVLLEAIHLGDGAKQLGQSWTRRSYHISTGNPIYADRLQSMCVRRGYRCSLAVHNYNRSPLYVLHIKDTTTRTLSPSGDRPMLRRETSRLGDEPVWCIETGTSTIVTRRRGKVTIMGNCQMVGRAARLYPGKTHATILDVVGSTREHQLVTLADLTGKAIKDKDGKAVAPGSTQGEDFQLAVPLDPTTVGGTSVDLFSGREFGWLELGEAFVLPVANGWVLLEPQPKDPDRWWVIAQRGAGEPPELVDHSLDLGYAQGVAEDLVRRLGSGGLARGDASWRQKAAKPGQMAALAKWGQHPAGALTAGAASDLLTATIARATWAKARRGGGR